MPKNQLLWRSFWITILSIFALWLFLFVKAELLQEKKIQVLQTNADTIQLESQLQNILKLAPQEIERILNSPKLQENITKIIETEITTLFEQVKKQIPVYADFHYSLKGEYIELWAYSQNDGGKYLKKYLFDATDFDTKMLTSQQRIIDKVYRTLHLSLEDVSTSLYTQTKLSEEERGALEKILALQIQSTLNRFENNFHTSLRASGVVGAGVIGALVAKKMGAKLAIKAGAKMGGALSAGAGGFALCAPSGPGAIACGVATGVAGWFATDKIILEGDEYLHREAFERELHILIEEEKNHTLSAIKNSFFSTLSQTKEEYTQKLQQSVRQRLQELSDQENK
ncbi:MAG: hypothetical protein J7J31_07320 [Helicobacteraceae bacterium]|nr:hypothetical protein [Helicobacteraceae bacterium]